MNKNKSNLFSDSNYDIPPKQTDGQKRKDFWIAMDNANNKPNTHFGAETSTSQLLKGSPNYSQSKDSKPDNGTSIWNKNSQTPQPWN